MTHVHVDATSTKLTQHLLQSVFAGLWTLRLPDPSQVVVPLVSRSPLVRIHQILVKKNLAYVTRHLVARPFRHGSTRSHTQRAIRTVDPLKPVGLLENEGKGVPEKPALHSRR